MGAEVKSGLFDRTVITCILTLYLGALHAVALKSKLLTRFGGLTDPKETPISYETLYFDQRVSCSDLHFRIFLLLCF